MSKRAGEKDEVTQEIESTLHYDASSRILALSGLPHLSNDHAQLFKIALAKQADVGSQSIKKSSKSKKRRLSEGGESSNTVCTIAESVPTFYHIHNLRCPACDNALLVGVNCCSTKEGFQCLTCGIELKKDKPNTDSKRRFRSVRCRKLTNARDVGMEGLEVVKPEEVMAHEPNVKSKPIQPQVMTLADRAATLKKHKKKGTKVDTKKELREIQTDVQTSTGTAEPFPKDTVAKHADMMIAKPNTAAPPKSVDNASLEVKSSQPKARKTSSNNDKSESSKSLQTIGRSKSADERKEGKSVGTTTAMTAPQKKELPWQKRDRLRQMLAEKRAKAKVQPPSDYNSGGLADFLGSL